MQPIHKMGGVLCNACRKVISQDHLNPPLLCASCLEALVYNWKTKNKEGFTHREENRLLAHIGKENMDMDKYYDALRGNTCMMIDGEIITYRCDILTALRCGLEKRNMKWYEWG